MTVTEAVTVAVAVPETDTESESESEASGHQHVSGTPRMLNAPFESAWAGHANMNW